MNTNEHFPILSLPPELFCPVLSNLDVKSVAMVSASCKTLNSYAEDDILWKILYFRDFPNIFDYQVADQSWKEQYRRQHIIAKYQKREEKRLKKLGLEITCLEDGYLSGY